MALISLRNMRVLVFGLVCLFAAQAWARKVVPSDVSTMSAEDIEDALQVRLAQCYLLLPIH